MAPQHFPLLIIAAAGDGRQAAPRPPLTVILHYLEAQRTTYTTLAGVMLFLNDYSYGSWRISRIKVFLQLHTESWG